MIQVRLQAGIHCNVTLVKGVGDIVTGSIGPFKNMVCKTGLNGLADYEYDTLVTYCHVGVGNDPVLISNTQLDSWTASTNNVIDSSLSTKGLPPYYSQRIKTWRFTAGTFNNHQISEIGFSDGATNSSMFSRALVITAFGKESSSWIRSDEWLDVVYDFRVYPQYANADGTPNDGIGTLLMNSISHSYVIRPSDVTDLTYWDASKAIAQIIPASATIFITNSAAAGYILSDISTHTAPFDGFADTTNSSMTNSTYVNDTYNRNVAYHWGPVNCNATGGIGGIRFFTGMGSYQMSFSPALNKVWGTSMTFRINLAWANKV